MTQVTIDQTMQTAVQHHQAGRLQQAQLLYQQILAEQPEHISAMHNLGLIAHQTGRNDIAIDLIRRSIALQPNDAIAYHNLGNVLAARGHLDEAITAYRQAIVLRPEYSQASYNLGNALRTTGRRHEAIAAYRQAIAFRPNYPEAYNNLGNALTDTGQLDDAIAAYRQGIALRPNDAQAHNNLGIALTDKGEHDQAIAACRRAIALNASSPKIHNNFGNALKNKGRLDEAIAAYRRAIALDPDDDDAHNNLGSALKDAGQLDASIAAYRQALAVRPDHRQARSNLIYALQFHARREASAISKEHRLWSRRHAEPLKQTIRAPANEPDPERRLRIGYISPDFREHPVGRFLLPLLECHDHSNFEILCYADVHAPDRLTERFRGVTDQWRNIVGMSDEQVAQLMRDDGVDILVDLTMHMANNRLLVFARKPAPVQVTWLAYPGTTGLDAMDYRLTDRYLDPLPVKNGLGETSTEAFYSEQSVRLPDCWFCYRPQDQTPEVNDLPALASSHVTFGCLNNFCKVTEETLACWCSLLRDVSDSHLLLHALEGSHRQGVRDLLAGEGVDSNRLRFVGQLPVMDYLRLYHQIDICLDPFPYSGGSTSCDALWMGVPVITMTGPAPVGRLTTTILHNMGLTELVAHSKEQYVQVAKELARDLGRLGQMRSRLRRKMHTSPLMDEPRFARNMEEAYRTMWRQWCEGRILSQLPGDVPALHKPELIAHQSDLAKGRYNLGVTLMHGGQPDAAIDAFREALALNPCLPDAHNNLGNLLRHNGNLDDAISAYRQALSARPNWPEAQYNLATALKDRGSLDDAIIAYRQAIDLKSDFPEAQNNLGNALRDKGDLDGAIDAFKQAIALRPTYAEVHSNLGNVLGDKGQVEAAIISYRQAISLKPDYADAHYNLAQALLLQGDFKTGWAEHEWRWKCRKFPSPQRNFPQPKWNGEELKGRRILLHAEQGLGDTIQFVRYASEVAGRGGKVILECQPKLRRLLKGLPAACEVVVAGQPLPSFDLHCPLMSLPLAFGTRLESILHPVRYLSADPRLIEGWANSLTGGPHQLKVGLAWTGNSNHTNDKRRSTKLAQFAPLSAVKGVRFYSLQKGPAAEEVHARHGGLTVIDFSNRLIDFAETAALIAHLDLVITVDTAVAHLAGAMGKPVWVLLPFAPDWRWLLDREDSPWYPTMRLFRQPAIDRWEPVVDRVAEHLALLSQ